MLCTVWGQTLTHHWTSLCWIFHLSCFSIRKFPGVSCFYPRQEENLCPGFWSMPLENCISIPGRRAWGVHSNAVHRRVPRKHSLYIPLVLKRNLSCSHTLLQLMKCTSNNGCANSKLRVKKAWQLPHVCHVILKPPCGSPVALASQYSQSSVNSPTDCSQTSKHWKAGRGTSQPTLVQIARAWTKD